MKADRFSEKTHGTMCPASNKSPRNQALVGLFSEEGGVQSPMSTRIKFQILQNMGETVSCIGNERFHAGNRLPWVSILALSSVFHATFCSVPHMENGVIMPPPLVGLR